MEMTVTRLPDGGVRYKVRTGTVIVYEHGRIVKDGKLTDEGKKADIMFAARFRAEKERTA